MDNAETHPETEAVHWQALSLDGVGGLVGSVEDGLSQDQAGQQLPSGGNAG